MDKLHYGYGLPPDLSTHGHSIDHLIFTLHIFMITLFVGWGIFLVYTLIRFRRQPGKKASYHPVKSKLPKYIEVCIVGFELFLLIGLSFPIWNYYKNQDPTLDPQLQSKILNVRVVAQQFAWYIHYPGEDKKFGRTDVKLVKDTNPLGIDVKDPASADDFVNNGQFYMPKDTPIVAEITAKDVIHSFGVPVLRLKQDANPGMVSKIWFTAKDVGNFQIVCSQLCGSGHSIMGGRMIVQSPEEFQKYLSEKKRPFAPKKPAASADRGSENPTRDQVNL